MVDCGSEQIEQCVRMACLLEATACKPGNVHPAASFDDLNYNDFVASSKVIAPILAGAQNREIGETILEAVTASHHATGKNANLGIVLLLTPLCAVSSDRSLNSGIRDILNDLTQRDASLVYQAIRLVQPGGMGQVADEDIASEPTGTLLEVMQFAADRDRIAEQYSNGFRLVLGTGLDILKSCSNFQQQWEPATINLHLRLMTKFPDTLIARKCGANIATESANRAARVLERGGPDTSAGRDEFEKFDDWLRADGNRRNPGTTADLVAACLFAAFRDRHLIPPDNFEPDQKQD